MAAREGLLDPERERMVGLKPVKDGANLTAGAHIFEMQEAPTRLNDQGYVTSVGYSPTLGHMIGLGFVKSGMARAGARMKMVDHLRKVETEVEICEPGLL